MQRIAHMTPRSLRRSCARTRAAASLLLAAAALTCAIDTAEARNRKKKTGKVDDETVDVSAIKDQLLVLTDGDGRYLAVYIDQSVDSQVFYSEDGKTFYRVWERGGGLESSTGRFSEAFWSPRVVRAEVIRKPAQKGGTPQWVLLCAKTWQHEDEQPLTELPEADARKIIDHATFRPPFWKRQPHFLARDDAGNYYYVDRLRDDQGGKGYRLFRGPKGSMKELSMTNVVADSVGEIFATKKGELRFVVTNGQAKWVFGSKSMELTKVPVDDNVVLIYADLGVYLGSLGMPCDDQ